MYEVQLDPYHTEQAPTYKSKVRCTEPSMSCSEERVQAKGSPQRKDMSCPQCPGSGGSRVPGPACLLRYIGTPGSPERPERPEPAETLHSTCVHACMHLSIYRLFEHSHVNMWLSTSAEFVVAGPAAQSQHSSREQACRKHACRVFRDFCPAEIWTEKSPHPK